MYVVEQLEHTTDIRLRLEADTLEELFIAGSTALNEILMPESCKGQECAIRHALKIRSLDTTSLLIDFLSDLLTLSYAEKVLFCKIEVQALGSRSVEAELSGCPVPAFAEDIKAVTYHEAEVHKNAAGKWQTLLVLDI